MEVTDVRLLLQNQERLKAFVTVCLDGEFVIHDIKVVESNGRLLVAMPSRKIRDECTKCNSKVVVTDKFCCHCGEKLAANRAEKREDGRGKLYADICHPIKTEFRTKLEKAVLDKYHQEIA